MTSNFKKKLKQLQKLVKSRVENEFDAPEINDGELDVLQKLINDDIKRRLKDARKRK